jgi:hypothetical protein
VSFFKVDDATEGARPKALEREGTGAAAAATLSAAASGRMLEAPPAKSRKPAAASASARSVKLGALQKAADDDFEEF